MMAIITPQGGIEAERSEAEFVSRIASEVFIKVENSLKPVLERMLAFSSDGAFKAYRTREACNLTGLRLRQFERFCEIMKATPTEAPFRAAQTVLDELPGRGGYPCASSLQRYAIMHRRHW